MNTYTVEQKYIKEIISQGIANLVSLDVCTEFNNYVSQKYSWEVTGYRIDWSKYPSCKRFNWMESSDEETAAFLQNTCLGYFEEVCVIYGAKEPGVRVSLEYAKENLDVLMYHGWGTRFLVAVENSQFNYKPKLLYDCFLEVDRTTWLTSPSE